jgi:uncharacterized membrane protein
MAASLNEYQYMGGIQCGLQLPAGLVALIVWLRSSSVQVKWYEWLIGIVGLLLLVFTIQNLSGSLAEYNSTAAWLFLPVTGFPALILLAVAWQLIARRQRAG